LEPRVIEAVWAAVEGVLPARPPDTHPLRCHRRWIADRACFAQIAARLVFGCSWQDAARLGPASATTLRSRRDAWVAAGVFDQLAAEAIAGYDRIIGLDLSEAAVDGSVAKAPGGGEGTGPNPTDRAKTGWKWSILTERTGIPVGWATDGANRHDSVLFASTLDAAAARGLLTDIGTLHLDRGYDGGPVRDSCAERGLTDLLIAEKRKKNTAHGKPTRVPLGLRWPVERTNSWLSNFGQLRRNTDRRIMHRLAQLALAVAFIITVKLVAWADRWNP